MYETNYTLTLNNRNHCGNKKTLTFQLAFAGGLHSQKRIFMQVRYKKPSDTIEKPFFNRKQQKRTIVERSTAHWHIFSGSCLAIRITRNVTTLRIL